MSDRISEALSLTDRSSDLPTDLPKRAVRALTEKMTVLDDEGRARGADGLYIVVSASGNSYLVDVIDGACECPDARHRDPQGGCKHQRRVEYAIGETRIPCWVEPDAVDDLLATAVDASPVVAATDGGTAVDAGTAVDGDARPDDCGCTAVMSDLPCWPCYREGFRTPADDGGETDE
jgi:hypothetical protein